MRTAWTALFAGVACVTAFAAPPEPETVALQASVEGAHGSTPVAISIATDGAVTTKLFALGGQPRAARVEIGFRLTRDELEDLRRRVAEARFFDEWGSGQRATDYPAWDVTVVLGAREKRRQRIYAQPEFEPLEQWLWRFVNQAQTVDWIREGRAVWIAEKLERADERARLIRPDDLVSDLVPALVRAIASAERPQHAHEPAKYLVRCTPAAEWPKRAAEVLAATQDDRRQTVLGVWMTELKAPERAAQRAAFAPTALAEAQAPWASGAELSDGNAHTLRRLLAFALGAQTQGALDVAADRARSLSTLDRAFFPWDDDGLGADGIALGVRLLDDREPAPRLAGARLLHAIADKARRPPKGPAQFDAMTSAETFARLRAEAVPSLERHAKSPDESLRVREECFEALAACEGRDLDAERRAANAAERERRAAESKAREEQRKAEEARRAEEAAAEAARRQSEAPPKGSLSIAGRVLAAGATPLAGFTVTASREDGKPQNRHRVYGWARTADDGSFRIEGLVEGAFSLVATGPGWSWRTLAKNSTLTDDVEAGETGVELRFVGAMLRGRITGPDGKPVADRDVGAHMRDAPSFLGDGTLQASAWGRTDREGRFLFLQLFEGVYDVEVPGVVRLTGSAVSTGAQERAVGIASGATMSGRVVDTAGLPVARASVRVLADGRRPVATVNTDAEGRFWIPDLDPDVRYTVCSSYVDIAARTGERSSALIEAPGCARDFVLTIDTGPSLALRVEFGSRAARARPLVRLERVGDGDPQRREFNLEDVFWRTAPPGEWKVFAHVRDVDGGGRRTDTWLEIGTVTTGEPKRTLSVPE